MFAQAQLFGQFDDLKKKELLDVANRLVVERDSVQQLVEEARASIALLTEQKEVQSGEIDLLRTDIVDRDATIDELEAGIASRVAEIEVLEKKVAALNDDIAELNRQLNVQEVLWNDQVDSLKAVIGVGNPTDSLSRVIQRLEGELQAANAAVTQMKNSSIPQWDPNATFLNRVYSNLESIDSQSLKLELVGVYSEGHPVFSREFHLESEMQLKAGRIMSSDSDGYSYQVGCNSPMLGRYYPASQLGLMSCAAGEFTVKSTEKFLGCRGASKSYGCQESKVGSLGLPNVVFEFLKGKVLTIRSGNLEEDWMIVGPQSSPVDGENGMYFGIIDTNDERYDVRMREWNGEMVLAVPHSLATRLKIVNFPNLSDDTDDDVFDRFHYYKKDNAQDYASGLSWYGYSDIDHNEIPDRYIRQKPYTAIYSKGMGPASSHAIKGPPLYFFRLVP
ncbi:MAG: hypothetical protein ACO3MV_04615 [Flavobacteriales bacterium]